MAVLSQTAEYALRTVLHLAARRDRTPVSVDQLAGALDMPRNYLSKTLSTLVHQGILSSVRGKRGGFALAVRPERLVLDDVVGLFDQVARPHCLLGNGACSDRSPCVAHEAWRGVADSMREFFRKTTVADILERDERSNRPRRRTAAPT
ncbi:MAG: Rrf2 family transcriptional regulator [Gemmatimonadales bacterium]